MKAKFNIKATKVTANEVINSDAKEYNASEWARIVNRYAQYENVTFYKVEEKTRYSRSEFLVMYTVNGLEVLGSISYGSSLHNGGFMQVNAVMCDSNYITFLDYFNGKFNLNLSNFTPDENKIVLTISLFNFGEKEGYAENTEKNRKVFIDSRTTVTRDSFLFLA
jgi:hypothetical protein